MLDLVRGIGEPELPVPASEWTVRELAVHLTLGCYVYAELAGGVPSPFVYESKQQFAATVAAAHADIPEDDPAKLAAMADDALGGVLDRCAGRPGSQPVTFHSGIPFDLGRTMAYLLGEWLLQGQDLAVALGRPWPIAPAHAEVVLAGHLDLLGLWAVRDCPGEGVVYEIRAGDRIRTRVRFSEGTCRAPPGDAADCVIDADPVALLLVHAGRLSPWSGFALGLIRAQGPRSELAPGLWDRFVFP